MQTMLLHQVEVEVRLNYQSGDGGETPLGECIRYTAGNHSVSLFEED